MFRSDLLVENLNETNALWHILESNWALEMRDANQNIGKISFKIYAPRRHKICLQQQQHLA